MYVTMFLIGLLCGTITGLLSVGGGIILIFSLIFFLPLISDTNFSMQTIAGFSIMQTFFSTLSGGYYYVRTKLVDRSIILFMGIPALFGGIIGALWADNSSEFLLKITFAFTAVLAAIIMQVPYDLGKKSDHFAYTGISITLTVISGSFIGIVGGLVGLGAGFLFVPLMIFIYKLPIKKAIGSSLITCFLLSSGSFITKLSIGAIPFWQGTILIIGGIIGAQIGGRIANRLNPITLKRIAAYSILFVSVKLFYDLFS